MNYILNALKLNEDTSQFKPFAAQKEIRKLDLPVFEMPSLILSPQQLCDIELLLNGGFSPLEGFMNQGDYDSVVDNMRLENNIFWPMPITLDVDQEFAEKISVNQDLLLKDLEGVPLAVLRISSIWTPDKNKEALAVFGTTDIEHPGVNYLLNTKKQVYIGGKLLGMQLPTHYNFPHIRQTPAELKRFFKENGWKRILGFQTRNPMHKAHVAMTLYGAEKVDAKILLNPVVGITKLGDIEYSTRVRCYEKLLKYYPKETAALSLLPLAMRMAGPREALWHAIIRKNYGCTHFLIGRDHAGCASSTTGKSYYGPYDAHELAKKHQKDLGIEIVCVEEMVHLKNKKIYVPITEVTEDQKGEVERVSGTQLRKMLLEGLQVPEWFSYPEVIQELRATNRPKYEQGLTIFFTGLSGAGKSTIANGLMVKLHEICHRTVTLLDGDRIRHELAQELGFSKEHRDMNILRLGYVASEITKHRGIAICAPIAPYEDVRRKVREKVTQYGGYVEIYVSTPLEVCEKRDRKGLYAKARAGKLKGFTGIDDVYEVPIQPELTLDTSKLSPQESIDQIIQTLRKLGYLK